MKNENYSFPKEKSHFLFIFHHIFCPETELEKGAMLDYLALTQKMFSLSNL